MQQLELREDRLVPQRANAAGEAIVELPNDASVSPMPEAEIVVLTFPTFKDGRAFSQARRLRQMGFGGDIRARGHLIPDQLDFAVRCGFTSFDLGTGLDPSALDRLRRRYGAVYQGGRRHRRTAEGQS